MRALQGYAPPGFSSVLEDYKISNFPEEKWGGGGGPRSPRGYDSDLTVQQMLVNWQLIHIIVCRKDFV
jgi:hypothetical protein